VRRTPDLRAEVIFRLEGRVLLREGGSGTCGRAIIVERADCGTTLGDWQVVPGDADFRKVDGEGKFLRLPLVTGLGEVLVFTRESALRGGHLRRTMSLLPATNRERKT